MPFIQGFCFVSFWFGSWQENGGCGFFEWCDSASGGNSSMAGGSYGGDSSHPGLQCPCGGGLCVVLTAKTGKNIGQQFYRCPSAQVLWILKQNIL